MVAGLTLVGCNTGNDLDDVVNNGFINVGITIYEPMDYFDDDGETIIGFDAELADAFAKTINVATRFTIIKWDSKVLELKSKKIDLTIPYATNYQCVVTKTANIVDYTNADVIKTKKVAVEQGSAGEKAAVGVTNLNKVGSQEAALLEVKAGTSDCAIIDVTMANAVVGKGDFTDLSTVSASKIAFDKEDFGVGVRKGSNITAKLNAFFKDSYKSGLLTTLSTKYSVALNEDTLK